VRLASIHWYLQGMNDPRPSLFAHELVSVKRLEKMLAGIRS
jgi:hypothetical protein